MTSLNVTQAANEISNIFTVQVEELSVKDEKLAVKDKKLSLQQQVQKAVESFYGVGSNGQIYLDRFVDYPLHLPVSQTRTDQLPLTELPKSSASSDVWSDRLWF